MQMSRIVLVAVLLFVAGCTGNSGPPTTSETSAARPELADRVNFIEQYVKFRRKYDQLEYDVYFRNGGSFPPAPSEWDIRIVARVDPRDLDQWAIAGSRNLEMETPDWVGTTAGQLKVGAISEWYADGGRTVGIDRDHGIVAYRNQAY